MVKRLTFVRRASGVPPDEFGRLWCEQAEAALGSMGPGPAPTRLAHCVVRPSRNSPPYDGVAIAWYEDESGPARHDAWLAAHAAARPSVLDETSTSSVLVDERTVSGDTWLVTRWSDPDPTPALLLIGCIEASAAHSRQSFRDYWWDKHRPFANRLVPGHLKPAAYVHDYVRPGEPGRWDGIGEMYEQSLDVARQRGDWFESEAALPLVEDEDRFLVRASRQLLVTDQQLIKPR